MKGTSQLQVVAAVRGVSSGAFESFVETLEKQHYDDPLLAELQQKLADGQRRVIEAIQFVKQQASSYLDLSGRQLVDSAITVIVGHLFWARGRKRAEEACRRGDSSAARVADPAGQLRAGPGWRYHGHGRIRARLPARCLYRRS